MNRLRSASLFLIGLSMLGGASAPAATPPKGEESVSGSKDLNAGNPARAAGSTKRTVDPVRSGVSEAGWLAALRHVQVTELQAPLITKIVRTYLEQAANWRRSMGLELDTVIAEVRRIREAGGDIPPELTTRVRMIRGAMPKWNVTQQRIISELTPMQVESLLLEIDRYKAKQRELRVAEARRRDTRKEDKAKSAGAVDPAGAGAAAVGAAAAEPKPPVAGPWSFVQAETAAPKSDEAADQRDGPVKTDG